MKLNRYSIHSSHPDIDYELVDNDFGTSCDADEAEEIIDALTKERDGLKKENEKLRGVLTKFANERWYLYDGEPNHVRISRLALNIPPTKEPNNND